MRAESGSHLMRPVSLASFHPPDKTSSQRPDMCGRIWDKSVCWNVQEDACQPSIPLPSGQLPNLMHDRNGRTALPNPFSLCLQIQRNRKKQIIKATIPSAMRKDTADDKKFSKYWR